MRLYEKNGVRFYRSELLPCPHGFATRIGGVSKKAHTRGLNLAFGRGDEDEVVLENLVRFSDAVGVSADSVISLPQVHGCDVIRATLDDRGAGYQKKSDRSADGYFTDTPAVTLGVKTADCVPILLCGVDENEKPAAVAALHAGWRGTALRIAERGVEAIVSLGIPCDRIRAAIGPAIGMCCYEVDAAFRDTFLSTFGEDFLSGTFRPRGSEKYTADLKEINRRILIGAGVLSENIDVLDECTACHPELFFSHRYSAGVRGTMLSVIALPDHGASAESE
ncbi:MAG: peptidoglycan editing factor PgeF [Clostridia bacterium]|nr:peptidoglycan editing factor PgeF [Clostridia bacterium]